MNYGGKLIMYTGLMLALLLPAAAQDLYFTQGKEYYKENNYYAAIEMLSECVKADRQNVAAHAMLVHSYVLAERADEGLAFYRKYLQDKPVKKALKNKVAGQCHKIAGNAVKEEEWEQARGALAIGMLLNPQYKDMASMVKKVDAALADAANTERKEELGKKNYALGLKALETKNFATATANFRKAVKYDPRFKQLGGDYLPMAKKAAEQGKVNTAVAYYKICLAFDPDNLAIHQSLVALLEKKDKNLLKSVYIGLKKSYPRCKPIAVDLPAGHVKEGDLLKQNGDYKLALAKYNQAALYNPSYKGLQNSIMVCKAGIAKLARQKEDRILAEKTYASAEKLFRQKKYKLAVPKFRKAVELDERMKSRAADWQKKGMDRIGAKKTKKKGAMYLRVAAALDMGNTDIQIVLMRSYIDINYMTLLKQHCAVFAGAYPPKTEQNQAVARAIFKDGEGYQKDGKFNKALIRYNIVSLINPAFKGNKENIAACQAELDKLAAAAANRKKAKGHYDQARKLFFKKQYKAAFPKFKLALDTDPSYKEKALPWGKVGDGAVKEKKLAKAVYSYRTGIVFDLEEKSLHERLILTWLRLKKGKTNLPAYYKDLQKQNPGSKFLHKELPAYLEKTAAGHQENKDYLKAIRLYSVVKILDSGAKDIAEKIALCKKEMEIAKTKKTAETAYKKGMKAMMEGQFTTASDLFEKAAKLEPGYKGYIARFKKEGLAEFKSKKYESASKKLGMVISRNIGDMELHKGLIEAGIKSGDMDYLFKLYEHITVEYPFEPTIRKSLPEYYYGQGKKHKAEGQYKRALLEFEVVRMLKPGFKDTDDQIAAVRKKAK